MKKKKQSKKIVADGCMTALPPWIAAKTKQAAFHVGLNTGRREGQQSAEVLINIQKETLAKQRGEAIVRAITAMAQSTEAMARATISMITGSNTY